VYSVVNQKNVNKRLIIKPKGGIIIMKDNFTSITGHVGRNPVLYHRNTKNGVQPVAKFSIAVNSIKNGKCETSWIQVSAWDKKSGIAMRNLRKGSAVQLFGFLKLDKYINRKGEYVENLSFNAQYINVLSRVERNTVKNAVNSGSSTMCATQLMFPGI